MMPMMTACMMTNYDKAAHIWGVVKAFASEPDTSPYEFPVVQEMLETGEIEVPALSGHSYSRY